MSLKRRLRCPECGPTKYTSPHELLRHRIRDHRMLPPGACPRCQGRRELVLMNARVTGEHAAGLVVVPESVHSRPPCPVCHGTGLELERFQEVGT